MVPQEQLRDTVERLRDELADGEPLEPAEREELEQTLAEVAGLLDAELEAPADQGLVDTLRAAALRFEESHPKLTLAIGAVADSLARLGL